MAEKLLKDIEVRNAKPRDRDYTLSDGGRLSLLVRKNGTKLWRYRYRFQGKQKMISLGIYPAVSLANARKKRDEADEILGAGLDPSEERRRRKQEAAQTEEEKKKRKERTFNKATDKYLLQLERTASDAHYSRISRLLNKYCRPTLGERYIGEIDSDDLSPILNELKDAGKYETGRKVMLALRGVFKRAREMKWTKYNPRKDEDLSGMFHGLPGKNYATLSKPKEIRNLLYALDDYKGEIGTRYALKFLLLSAFRSANVRRARWEWVDFDDATMTIPKEEMKIVRSRIDKYEDFRVPMSRQMVEILKRVRVVSGNGTYIFPSTRGDRPVSDMAYINALRRMGYSKEELTPHGLRALFSTIANDHSPHPWNIIEAALAHKIGGSVSQSYNRGDYFDKRRELMQWWADWLDALREDR